MPNGRLDRLVRGWGKAHGPVVWRRVATWAIIWAALIATSIGLWRLIVRVLLAVDPLPSTAAIH